MKLDSFAFINCVFQKIGMLLVIMISNCFLFFYLYLLDAFARSNKPKKYLFTLTNARYGLGIFVCLRLHPKRLNKYTFALCTSLFNVRWHLKSHIRKISTRKKQQTYLQDQVQGSMSPLWLERAVFLFFRLKIFWRKSIYIAVIALCVI